MADMKSLNDDNMTDFRALARHHPAIRSYIRHRKWVDRSGVLAYAANTDGKAFSTDSLGFRRGQIAGIPYDSSAAFSGKPYALVLGSSHVFGFGLAGDAQTIPSQLAALTGVPCLNLSFPEAQLQALHAVATRICQQAPRPPAFIAVLPGGTLTRYAFVRRCDPLFGVPDFRNGAAPEAMPGSPQETTQFEALLVYATFWLSQFRVLADQTACPLLVHPEATAFEKPALSETEMACGVTTPQSDPDRLRFETHRLRYDAYTAAISAEIQSDTRLVQVDKAALRFLDEFHYTAAGAQTIATALADALHAG